jgi:hypothetical protein
MTDQNEEFAEKNRNIGNTDPNKFGDDRMQ